MGLYRADAVVLKSRNFGEADRVLVLLSEDHGKFEAVVKGARRQRSRFVGSTLPFNLIRTLVFPGKNLDTISQAELVHSFAGLREDLTRMAYASYWVELIDGFVPEREEAGAIFRFLLAAFIVLEKTADPEVAHYAFQVRIMELLGYQPQLDGCVNCGVSDRPLVFAADAGGVVCPDCRNHFSDAISVDSQTLLDIGRLGTTDLRELAGLNLSGSRRRLIGRILRSFVEFRLERPLKSQVFLDNLLE